MPNCMPYGVTGKKVLVTGGSGFMGRYLVQQLSDAGNDVKVLTRKSSETGSFSKLNNVSIVKGDICEPSSLCAAVKGVEIVYHLAALLHLPHDACNQDLRKVNVVGTKNLLEACRQNRVAKFVYFSTAGVPSVDKLVNDLDPNSDSPLYYGESKLAGENLVNEYHLKYSMNTTILRPVVVYGCGDRGNMVKLINAVQKKFFVLIGGGTAKRTLVYVKNVTRAAFCVTLNPMANGKIYCVADGKPLSIREIAEEVASKYNISLLPFRVPLWLAHPIALACELVQKIIRIELPYNMDIYSRITYNQEISSRSIEEELGFIPIQFSHGLAETIEEMEAQRRSKAWQDVLRK